MNRPPSPNPLPTLAPFVLVVDTREQRPYEFGLVRVGGLLVDVRAVREALPAGDYSIVGHQTAFAIERKSAEDAYATFSRGRARFLRELERLRSYAFAAILLEATPRDLLTPPAHVQRVAPGTVLNSLCSWAIDYGVSPLFAGDRDLGRAFVIRLAERFHRRARSSRATAPEVLA